MSKRVPALVDGAMLSWARARAGLSLEAAARKVPVKPERLQKWEANDLKPTFKQLLKLANAYHRHVTFFYLPEPPDERRVKDFRRVAGKLVVPESPSLLWQMRQAQERRRVALELFEELEGDVPPFEFSASMDEDPEGLARRIREFLGLELERQSELRTSRNAFNWWRAAFERAGVLVFQAKGVDTSEMRGFSISETPLPAIVVNISDALRGRVFSMLHEFVHISLGDGGLCDLSETGHASNTSRLETFANRTAGAALVPADALLKDPEVAEREQGRGWADDELNALVTRYQASREVVLLRLLTLRRISRTFYELKKAQIDKENRELHRQKTSGFAPPAIMAVATSGKFFTQLALRSYYSERITASALSSFLDVKLSHMPRIETAVMGHAVEFGRQR